MARQYTDGASVVSMDGHDVGTVERVEEDYLVVRLHESARSMRVPFDVIDATTSTEDRVVIQGAVGDIEASRTNPRITEPGDGTTLALAGEEAIAHVHEVSRGRVVVDKHIEVVPHEANIDVGTDRVDVERIPVNKEVNQPPSTRQEGDTLIVPVVEEVLVVTKRYRIVEEVHVRKYRDVQTETFQEDLKREVVEVREIGEDGETIER